MINTQARLAQLEQRRASARERKWRQHSLGLCLVVPCGNEVTVNPSTGRLYWKCRTCRIKESAIVRARQQRKQAFDGFAASSNKNTATGNDVCGECGV